MVTNSGVLYALGQVLNAISSNNWFSAGLLAAVILTVAFFIFDQIRGIE